jgi:hydrogenase expression/formation protein HypC
MYLGVPARVLSVDGRRAQVECWGARMQVRLDVMDVDLQAGDYVLSHAGFAIRRIAREDVGQTLELYEILFRFGVPEASLRR